MPAELPPNRVPRNNSCALRQYSLTIEFWRVPNSFTKREPLKPTLPISPPTMLTGEMAFGGTLRSGDWLNNQTEPERRARPLQPERAPDIMREPAPADGKMVRGVSRRPPLRPELWARRSARTFAHAASRRGMRAARRAVSNRGREVLLDTPFRRLQELMREFSTLMIETRKRSACTSPVTRASAASSMSFCRVGELLL
jgi:hypothetical protein